MSKLYMKNMNRNKKSKKKDESFSGKIFATSEEISTYKLLVEEIESWDLDTQLSAVTNIRKLLSSETHPPINAFINVGVVAPLVQCLSSKNQELQHEAAWALTNIASGNLEQTKYVVEAGAIPYFVVILNDGNNKLCEQVLWGLANISTDNNHRELLFEHDIIAAFNHLLNSNLSNNAIKEVAQIIVNLSETKIFIKDFQKTANFLSLISKLIKSDEVEVLRKALLAIVKLTDRGPEIIQFFLENDFVIQIIPFLAHEDTKIVSHMLDASINLSSGDECQTLHFLSSGILDYMNNLLVSNPNKKCQIKAIKLLSNFTADSHQSLEFVIDANLIPIIIEIAKENPEISFQKECANVLCNALMCAKKEQVQYLFNEGIGDSLCSFIENPNPEIIKIIIFDLSSILEIIDEVYQEIPLQIKASLQKSKGRNGFTDPQTVELLRHFLEQF